MLEFRNEKALFSLTIPKQWDARNKKTKKPKAGSAGPS